jgi:apolipoprotein N-acyltransferase
VPFGEYIPWRFLFGWLSKVVPIGPDLSAGTDPTPLLVPLAGGETAIAPLICYEDVFPDLARSSVRLGADVLVVLTNDGWYGEEGAAYQHAAHSVLRAVEERRPVLRCGNAGWSGWIDEYGGTGRYIRGEFRSGEHVLQTADASVYFRGTRTLAVVRDARWVGRRSFYCEYGDWFVLVCALLACFGYALAATASVQRS